MRVHEDSLHQCTFVAFLTGTLKLKIKMLYFRISTKQATKPKQHNCCIYKSEISTFQMRLSETMKLVLKKWFGTQSFSAESSLVTSGGSLQNKNELCCCCLLYRVEFCYPIFRGAEKIVMLFMFN